MSKVVMSNEVQETKDDPCAPEENNEDEGGHCIHDVMEALKTKGFFPVQNGFIFKYLSWMYYMKYCDVVSVTCNKDDVRLFVKDKDEYLVFECSDPKHQIEFMLTIDSHLKKHLSD